MPERPLYREADIAKLPEGGNAGLWYDKFCDQWTLPESLSSGKFAEIDKTRWIATVTKKPNGNREELQQFVQRQLNLVKALKGHFAVFTTESRFVTGLGRSHPVENGFAWHPTLGTPYLPGSSVKGLVRAWTKLDADPAPTCETVRRLLGDRDAAGSLSFLDAVPIAPVPLEADIMTPHYAGWSKSDLPGDWRSPTPIPFLTTAAGTQFLFGVVSCSTVIQDDLCTVMSWLRTALKWAGAGAKTAVGYGQFCHDSEATRSVEKQLIDAEHARHKEEELQELLKTPEGRWKLKLQGKSEAEILDLVRIHLEKEPLEDPLERRAFAQALKATGYLANWQKGIRNDSITKLGKKKLKIRARLVKEALEVKINEPRNQSPTGDHPPDEK